MLPRERVVLAAGVEELEVEPATLAQHHLGRRATGWPADLVRGVGDVPGGDDPRPGLVRDAGALGQDGAELAQVDRAELDGQPSSAAAIAPAASLPRVT